MDLLVWKPAAKHPSPGGVGPEDESNPSPTGTMDQLRGMGSLGLASRFLHRGHGGDA